MTHGEVDDSIHAMQQFAEGFENKAPEEQRLDQQAFIMAFAAGLLQEMPLDPPLYPQPAGRNRALANHELRAQVVEQLTQDPTIPRLVLLKRTVNLLGAMYDELAYIEPVFKYEAQMAHNIRNLVHTRGDVVDEGLATAILRRAELLEPVEK